MFLWAVPVIAVAFLLAWLQPALSLRDTSTAQELALEDAVSAAATASTGPNAASAAHAEADGVGRVEDLHPRVPIARSTTT